MRDGRREQEEQMKKAVAFSVILTGFTAMASQIIFMREFLTVFSGNELSIGYMLASWLIGGAIGSLISGRFVDRIRNGARAFSLCLAAIGILLPLNILAIRSVRNLLGMLPGEIMPFFPMAMSGFLILVPVCAVLGFMFALACSIYGNGTRTAEGRIGRVYVMEAAGAIAGGVLASFVLIRVMDPVYITGILSFLNILAAFFLLCFSRKARYSVFLAAAMAVMLVAVAAMWPLKGWETLRRYSLKEQWKGYELLASRDSIYGNIAVARRSGQVSFFDNGLHFYTVPDRPSAEEAVHFALLEDPSPGNVLLIGGGVGGLAAEALKHPVKKLDYVELDPLIIEMARQYLPEKDLAFLKDGRVSVRNVDGRYFVKTTDEKYDCIIIHLGDPATAQINRYYTLEFFREARKILKDDGVISFALTSSESYINRELGDFLASVHMTMERVFGDVKVIPGETAYFLASPQKGLLTYDHRVLTRRAEERGLDIQYVRDYYLFSRLSPEKTEYTENAIKRERGIEINSDLRPIAYYYYTVFWMTRFRGGLMRSVLEAVNGGLIWKAGLGICGLFILSGLIRAPRAFRAGRERYFKGAMPAAVAVMGFSAISFQMATLLSFQIMYGYLFYKLGFILTSFMIGLALGGWWSVRAMPRIKEDRKAFIGTQAAACIYPVLLPALFLWLAGSRNVFLAWAGPNVFFPAVSMIAGAIGGFRFPLANKIYLGGEKAPGRSAGLNYGADLAGSCLGAFFAGAFLIPVLGIPGTCLMISAINVSVLIMLLLPGAKSRDLT
ncbi:MAG: hypothetical protein ABIA77_03090 [Candidatus Omnitrophota bacterium]